MLLHLITPLLGQWIVHHAILRMPLVTIILANAQIVIIQRVGVLLILTIMAIAIAFLATLKISPKIIILGCVPPVTPPLHGKVQ
jgi:hypothetical protein